MKTICFCAGIHGNETAPSFAMLDFLKEFDFRKARGVRIIFIPVANPTGFLKKRRNYRDIDLNRHFSDKKLRGENKVIYSYVKKKKVCVFCSLHEDEDERNFYLYGFESVDKKIYNRIIKLSKKFFSTKQKCVLFNGRCLFGHSPKNGIVMITKKTENDGSIENRLFLDGKTKFLLCTETPMKKKFQDRVKLNKKIMEEVIKISKL